MFSLNKEPVCVCWSINIFLEQIINPPSITGITFQPKRRKATAKNTFSIKSEILLRHCSCEICTFSCGRKRKKHTTF